MVLVTVVVPLTAVGFWAYPLFDYTRTDQSQMRPFSKPGWVLLLVFTNLVGALMWFFAGRPQRPSPR